MSAPYDVVVIGAGTAGCVLASRLSDTPDRQVLLLEAGPDVADEPPSINGASFFDALAEPGRTWPTLVAERTPGGPFGPYRRGRGTGGSSAVNAMIAMVPPAADLDRWAQEYSCIGWSAADVLPVFDALPVPLSRSEPGPVAGALADAANEPWEVRPATLTRWPDGRRASAASVYLDPVRSRPNLTVRGDVLVDRVLFDGDRAVGVRLADGGEIIASEVVVAAGAIHSPAILLRSGVDRRGVGRNLCEHPSCSVGLEMRHPVDPHGPPVTAYAARADLQLLALDHVGADALGWAAVVLSLMRTRSRGTVTLASTDPHADPVVRLNLLEHPADRAAMVEGVGWLREVLDHPAIAAISLGCYLDDVGTPVEALGDDPDEVAAWLSTSTGDYVHAAGTCAMGSSEDPDAVVDPNGRVIGRTGLRVCDASVFPELPSVNPVVMVLAVAERLASRWDEGPT